MENFQNSINKISQAIKYLEKDVPTIMGVEAVNHYKDSFQNQGFTDKGLQKWDEVERRKSGSRWKGFQYGSTVPRPGQKQRKKGSQTNYSPAAESRPILSGTTQELMNSIKWEKTANGIRVYSDVVYAKLQNQGGDMSIFGKKRTQLKKNQFMGQANVMRNKLIRIITNDLKRIFK